MNTNKNKIYKSYDSNILEALFLKYKVSKYYIRQSISGAVSGIKPDNIKRDYAKMVKANEQTIANLLRNVSE
ncbi:hypothetical protein [Flavobacterium sp. DG2-3]|uniref:hypothetical protein n=1 Tax=Flavobacterium sp. DG2-3 TaxID=3068317 RepID=UPI0027400865|nr:hypothetical protein [Flavobacterium sp. DG2-3]MDP5201132.1 hypothetical protein [Flavobacterium sp. DG2-3]